MRRTSPVYAEHPVPCILSPLLLLSALAVKWERSWPGVGLRFSIRVDECRKIVFLAVCGLLFA